MMHPPDNDYDDPHAGHNHPPIDQGFLDQMVQSISEALPIDNAFLMFVPNPPRFIFTNLEHDGSMRVLGYIPFDFMLEMSIGLMRGVQSTIVGNLPVQHEEEVDVPTPPPTQIGPFRVI